jgi:hypothetical protein
MPYVLTWEGRGFYKRFTGKVAFREFARSQEQVLSDPHTDEAWYVINDLLAIEDYAIMQDEAEYSAAFNRGTSFSNPRLRIAFVTTDLKLIMLIRFAAPFSSLEMRTFPSVDEARAWGLEERS